MQYLTISKLLNNLNRQKQLYLDMLSLTQKESELILNADIENLSKVVAVKEALIKELGGAEVERLDMVQELKIEDLMQQYPAKANELNQAKNELKEVLKDINEAASKNASFIQKALSGIGYIKNLFEIDDSSIIYRKNNSGNKSTAKNLVLDEKV